MSKIFYYYKLRLSDFYMLNLGAVTYSIEMFIAKFRFSCIADQRTMGE